MSPFITHNLLWACGGKTVLHHPLVLQEGPHGRPLSTIEVEHLEEEATQQWRYTDRELLPETRHRVSDRIVKYSLVLTNRPRTAEKDGGGGGGCRFG